MTHAIGIDIGGTNIKSVVIDPTGQTLHTDQQPTPQNAQGLIQAAQNLITQHPNPVAIGIAAPGLAAPDGSRITWMQGRLDAVQDLHWADELKRPASVLNDAHAATLAEAWIGAARHYPNAVMLTLGTGVGGGVIINGKLLTGSIGRAGHLGHIALNLDGPPDIVNTPGSLEDFVGQCTLPIRSNGRYSATRDLLRDANNGDSTAQAIWDRSVYALAAGLTSIINVLDPQVIVLGGGIALAQHSLFDSLQKHLDAIEWRPTQRPVKLLPAQLGEFAGAIGAARFAMLQLSQPKDHP